MAFLDEASDFLISVGYDVANVVRPCTFTAPAEDGSLAAQSVDLVAFADRPHDMRSACIAALSGDDTTAEKLRNLRYLTSPLALVGYDDRVELWPIRKSPATRSFDVFNRSQWQERARTRLTDYSPKSIVAAKQDRIQLDFVDAGLGIWTRHVTSASLTNLLEELLNAGTAMLPPSTKDKQSSRTAVLRLIFHLFTSRVLEDKGVILRGIDAVECLQLANERFSKNVSPDVLDSPYISNELVSLVFETLRSKFSFATLTTDVLSHSYENALVTKTTRRRHGIHYTPPALAEYVLKRLPVEVIPRDSRFLWDPCCGCGSFLLAGFDRLAKLLPDSFTGPQRHEYLTQSLFGSDLDSFACELAALALVLTDLHNRNGWNVNVLDAMSAMRNDVQRPPTIIVTNAPFREIKEGVGTRRELAADILERLLTIADAPALIGIVMPQSFLDGRAAKDARKKVLETCNILEISLLPGGLFESAAETAVFLLQRKEPVESRHIATIRELRSADYQGFVRNGAFTRTYPADPSEWQRDSDAMFIVSPLTELWKRLQSSLSPLGDFATVANGLQLKPGDSASVSDKQHSGARPFIDRLDVLRPYSLLTEHGLVANKWIRYGEQLHRPRNPVIFESVKVLINSNRNPGSAWRLVAAPSRGKLYFSDNFHAIIPKGAITVEQLCAVLNSPIANAWFDSHCRKRKVVLSILKRLPFPEFDAVTGREINSTVKAMERAVTEQWKQANERMFYDGFSGTSDTAKLATEIDQLIYDAYGLSRDERRNVDGLMATDKRPG